MKFQLPNGDIGHDALSITSNASSTTVSSASTLKSDEANRAAAPPPKEDDRSDLLEAIRTGISAVHSSILVAVHFPTLYIKSLLTRVSFYSQDNGT